MKVLVVGKGVSGTGAGELLKKNGFKVKFACERVINAKSLTKLMLDRLLDDLSFIVVSPGVSPSAPLLKEAKKRKIKITSELELASRFAHGDVIAVTGTNGKTTTVSLINFLLQSQPRKVFLGGNIGIAYSSFAGKTAENDITVLECSSFQLRGVEKFRPHIACILNITPDHLNYHKTLRNYISCKKKIAKKQTENDFLLLNADDNGVMSNIPKTKATIYYFSTKKKVFGCYVKSNCIYFNDNLKEKKLASLKGVKLVGEHNKSNIVCACLAVYLQTKTTDSLNSLAQFQGVSHRIEFVKKAGGVNFYDDSKATNIDSTLASTKSFDAPINLILGGSDKGYKFDKLFQNLPKNVKFIAVCGETKNAILTSAKKFGFESVTKAFADLKQSIYACKEHAKVGEIVLLSPACASFDAFSSYKERGEFFKKIVEEICSSENSSRSHEKSKPQ